LANKKISELTTLTSGSTPDLFAIVDTSVPETKNITLDNLMNSGVSATLSGVTINNDLIINGKVNADIDMDGHYITSDQGRIDLAARGPGYYFNGVDAFIDCGSSADTELGGELTVQAITKPLDILGSQVIVSRWGTTDAFVLYSGNAYVFNTDGLSDNSIQLTTLPEVGVMANAVFAYSETSGKKSGYMNGKLEVLETGVTGTLNGSPDALWIGKLQVGLERWLSAELYLLRFFNLALDNTDPEDKAIINGGGVPFKYVGAGRTELTSNGGFETPGGGGADIWSVWQESVGDGALANETSIKHSGSDAAKFTAGASANTLTYLNNIAVTSGKSYRYSFWTYGNGTHAGRYRVYDETNSVNILATTSTGVTTAAWTQVNYEFVAPAGCTQVDLYLYCSATNGVITFFDDASLTQIGCVARYEPENFGHGQTIESSGNELHGTVDGPILFGHPANHTEKYIDLSLTGNSSFTLPMGYKITSIVAKETAGNALTGGLDVGFSANGTEVVSGEAIGASATVNCTLVASGVLGGTHTTADDTIYFSDGDDDGNWNSAELEVRVEMIRLTVN